MFPHDSCTSSITNEIDTTILANHYASSTAPCQLGIY